MPHRSAAPSHYLAVNIVPRPDHLDAGEGDDPDYVWIEAPNGSTAGYLPATDIIPAAHVIITGPDGLPIPPPTVAAELRRLAAQLDWEAAS